MSRVGTWHRWAVALLLVAGGSGALGAPLAPEAVPAPLKDWVPWVLHGHEDRDCPRVQGAETRRCVWPSGLTLDLGSAGGTFEQVVETFAEAWVTLPGSARHWPQGAAADGAAVAVVERDGTPAVRLGAGTHRVTGSFAWARMPEALQLPRDAGLVRLTVEGAAREAPEVEPDGRLWLARERPAGKGDDGLQVRVFRRLVDEVPFQVVTRVELEVAGDPRELLLGPLPPADAIPMALEGPLPARLEADGRLRVQVRPGRWSVQVTHRLPGPVAGLARPVAEAPWPAEEVWVLDARPTLRVVEPRGLEALDPRQTSLPGDWQGLPAYRARPGDRLELAERRRGDPEPDPNRLTLERTLWLDFDGGGATVQDRIAGTVTRGWRLEAEPSLHLGRVAVDGRDQLITRLPGAAREGVEVRGGRLDLTAEGRIEGDVSRLPALGWAEGFQRVGATLHLPPGWRLFAAGGVDQAPEAWLYRWTLFDLFLLLVVSAAVGKLWGWGWGLLALGALGLGYHEQGMPLSPWLYLLAAVALLRVLPEGRLRAAVKFLRWAALAGLAVLTVPFVVAQVRIALFPVLERPWQVVHEAPVAAREEVEADVALMAEPAEALEEAVVPSVKAPQSARLRAAAGAVAAASAPVPLKRALEGYDPKAAIQTGPGLPAWNWDRARLGFSGPVERGGEIRLWLVPPAGSLLWHLLVALLLVALAGRLGWPDSPSRGGRRATPATPPGGAPVPGAAPAPAEGPAAAGSSASVVPSGALAGSGALTVSTVLPVGALVALLAAGLALAPEARAEFPPPKLLEDLRVRLLAPPECAPRCAEAPRMGLEVAGDALRLDLEVLALADVAVPLPGGGTRWVPRQVLVDGQAAPALARDEAGVLWTRVGPGGHRIVLEGALAAARAGLELTLPLRPRRVEVRAEGWRVDGLGPDGQPEGVVRLVRERAAEGAGDALAPSALPPLLRVERTLRLGLEWQVDTRVVRLSPTGAGLVVEVPLLAGEAVTSAGVRVENARVAVSLGPNDRELGWSSTLAKADRVVLEAPATTEWTETWRLDAGPTWHVEPAGLAPTHRPAGERWLPEWRPWPGERLELAISRPEGVPGPTLTLDRAALKVVPGQRSTDADLGLVVRSSQGGQTVVRLPADAELRSVTVDGVAQPVRQDGDRVVLPVHPGEQRMSLAWREPVVMGSRFETPRVDVGHPLVNAVLTVEVPRSRWVLLTGGPALGPAVLFWGVLLVFLGAAAGLGRLRLTPLRTWQWALLGVGLTQAPAWSAVLVVGWLLALGARARAPADLPRARFDLMQVGLVLLTLTALGLLFDAVRNGLLGLPEMQVEGNGSNGYLLRWYQDRSGPELPRASVLSAPLWLYRALMLAWALWLAFALLGWLRWGWEAFRTGGLWRPFRVLPWRRRPPEGASG